MLKFKNKKIFLASLLLAFAFFVANVSAVDCWSLDNQTACVAQSDCQWQEDPWGSWCEEKGCWNFWIQSECESSNNASSDYYINKSCNWQSGTESGWCMEVDCWAFDGTNANTCVNNSYGLTCNWISTYDADSYQYPCMGPPEKQCWNYSSESACTAVSGCGWGVCMKLSCWDYSNTNKTACEAQTGFNGKSCNWEKYSWGSECVEQGCWNYDNKTACENNDCSWEGSYCSEKWCSDLSFTNASYCENNTYDLGCSWDSNNKYCNDKGCWNYETQSNCNSKNASGCFWETHTGGWCEEVGCWSYDGINASACINNSANLNCVWENNWCYENVTAKSCSNINNERDCMDTFYCWWNFSAENCNDPSGIFETKFVEWNPGCFIFDSDNDICQNTTGCYLDNSKCETNTTIIPNGQLNCSMINNQTICNSIPAFSTCCKWQSSSCVADKFDQSCREQIEEPPEGAYYCEDYNAFTDSVLCGKIAGYPWYMPCEWNSSLERCQFKDDKVFGSGEKNIMKLDNQKNCEAAGGKWITESYCERNVAVPMGRCEFKFDEERNCDKECYACEYKSDKTKWESKEKAKSACVESMLGICGFTANSNAPNGYGYCEPKEEFKKGLASADCDSDCGACTYYGDATANKGSKPSDYCKGSLAKCKWIADPSHPNDESYGRCVSQAEKTCEDRCDKCYDESACKKIGGKEGDSSAEAVCEWDNGICKYKSGASELEVCWDGIDNNNDGKMDCADSMCWSDPFCGGDFMFKDFGKDCFGFSDQSTCESEGCAWINETWGSWCDMPGAICWKLDGTNQSYCESNSAAGNGTCEWHSGFGGFCENDWNTGSGCMNKNKTACADAINDSCIWVIDNWCLDYGGWCDPDPSYTGAWYDCVQHDMDGNETCESHPQCNWYTDSWCDQQGENVGFCDHMSFTCWQFMNQSDCADASNATFNHSQWCQWNSDPYSPEGGWCEGKMMNDCWNYNDENSCTTANCNWMSGFCDPKGFGGEFMPGMGGEMSGGGGAMGGFGMQCFEYDGNQSGCGNETGCGWFEEPWPFCDIDFSSSCPQYSYNQTICEEHSNCKYNAEMSFCDEKPFECFWNSSLQNNLTLCDEHSLCYNNSGHCDPICFSKSDENTCDAVAGCRWMTGWCNPAMAAEFFGGMDMGAPPIPLGTDIANDTNVPEVDIISFGLKDMGEAFGFGITVNDISDAAACNDIKMPSGTGTGKNTTKFFWYFDTDGNTGNNCNLKHNSSLGGYEFYVKNEWSYDNSTGSVNENPAAYRCADGEWQKAEIRVSSVRQLMCSMMGGAMVGIEKTELEKFSDLYTPGTDIRVYVASADSGHNISNPSDVAEAGWATPGAFDFNFDDFDMFKFEKDSMKKAGKEGADAGFIEYNKEADCWTQEGCSDYSCEGHSFCVENKYGVEAEGFEDTRMPKIIGVMKETYLDSAFVAYFTDKPANGTLKFYGNDSTCKSTSLNATINDIGITSSYVDAYKLWHTAEIYNETLGYSLNNNTQYYFRVKICDEDGKCGESKCSSFITEPSVNCPFCNFVTKIKAPSGWEVYYDLDQNGTYEHWQGNVCGTKAGMKTNYTTGRSANIRLVKSDNSTYFEFVNVRLTKTGLNTKTRDIESNNSLSTGTTSTTGGGTVGYAGMIEETRDKIINNLFPEICYIKIPGTGSCSELWHCDNNLENCVDRSSESNVVLNETGTDYCIWQIPCEFSVWAGGQPGTSSADSGRRRTEEVEEEAVVTESGIYPISKIHLITGYTKELKLGNRFTFNIEGESHYVSVDAISSNSVRISVASNLQQATLSIGEVKKFDLSQNGIYDISVSLNKIVDDATKASITVKAISEKIAAEESKPATEGTEGIAITGAAVKESAWKEKQLTGTIFIAVAVLALLAIALFLRHREKHHRWHRRGELSSL